MNNKLIKEFTVFHDRFLQGWKNAMDTGDTALIEKMDQEYYVTFFTEEKKPTYYNRSEAIEGLRSSVAKSVGILTKNFENRVIRMKAENQAIVFYEQVLVQEGLEKARLFTIENWQKINSEWLLTREVEERIM